MAHGGEDGEDGTTLARTVKVLQALREENLRLREENVEMKKSAVEGGLGGGRGQRFSKHAPDSSQLEAVLEAPVQQHAAPQPPMVTAVPVAGPASVEVSPMSRHAACTNAGPGGKQGQATSQPPVSRYPTTPGAQQRAQVVPGLSKSARPSMVAPNAARMARPSAGTFSRGHASVDGLASPASTATGPAFVPNSLTAPRGILYPPPVRGPVPMR